MLEDLIEEVQFYGNHPEFKDDQSLVCTVLFDYMTRKFQLRDRLIDEPFDNEDQLVTQIETSIYNKKTLKGFFMFVECLKILLVYL